MQIPGRACPYCGGSGRCYHCGGSSVCGTCSFCRRLGSDESATAACPFCAPRNPRCRECNGTGTFTVPTYAIVTVEPSARPTPPVWNPITGEREPLGFCDRCSGCGFWFDVSAGTRGARRRITCACVR